MRKVKTSFLAIALLLSISVVGDAIGSNAGATANAQIGRDVVRLGKTTYRGGRWVSIRVYRGGKWVTKRVWQAGKWVWRGGKRVFVRSKRLP